MKALGILTGWTALATAVGYLAFAPGSGLIHSGPWSTLGLALLGASVCRYAAAQQRALAAEPSR
ncbi:MAG: hypothetical protein OER86_02565 [Phycisphaerae bacterium]|nr:hypothetical protein [Phycisphaerae bacterium]